jgi:hypothetical protein
MALSGGTSQSPGGNERNRGHLLVLHHFLAYSVRLERSWNAHARAVNEGDEVASSPMHDGDFGCFDEFVQSHNSQRSLSRMNSVSCFPFLPATKLMITFRMNSVSCFLLSLSPFFECSCKISELEKTKYAKLAVASSCLAC